MTAICQLRAGVMPFFKKSPQVSKQHNLSGKQFFKLFFEARSHALNKSKINGGSSEINKAQNQNGVDAAHTQSASVQIAPFVKRFAHTRTETVAYFPLVRTSSTCFSPPLPDAAASPLIDAAVSTCCPPVLAEIAPGPPGDPGSAPLSSESESESFIGLVGSRSYSCSL